MANTTSTINFLRYQVSKITDSGLNIPENQTLNKYLGASEPYTMATTKDYKMSFFCIGNNGYDEGKADGDPPMSGVPGRNKLLGVLYRHMPFVMFKESDGIVVDTQKYGCKVRVVANGSVYTCYFAKRIDAYSEESLSRSSLYHGDTVGSTNVMMDSTKPSGLYVSTDKVSVSRNAVCKITQDEIDAVRKYGEVVLGNPDYGMIRELGLLCGIQDSVTNNMSNLFLAASLNIGNIIGITTASNINVSIGRSSMLLQQ